MKTKQPAAKRFTGKTEFKLDYSTPEKLEASKKERHFFQRMLRAYLKGAETFAFGFDAMTGKPVRYKVMFEYKS